MNNTHVSFIVDTGATVDLIDLKTYESLKCNVTLGKSTTKTYAYDTSKPLSLKGQFETILESKTQCTVSQIYVVEGKGSNLLSAKMAQDLSLVRMINRITSMPAHPAAKNKAELDSNTNGVTCLHNTIKMVCKNNNRNKTPLQTLQIQLQSQLTQKYNKYKTNMQQSFQGKES